MTGEPTVWSDTGDSVGVEVSCKTGFTASFNFLNSLFNDFVFDYIKTYLMKYVFI